MNVLVVPAYIDVYVSFMSIVEPCDVASMSPFGTYQRGLHQIQSRSYTAPKDEISFTHKPSDEQSFYVTMYRVGLHPLRAIVLDAPSSYEEFLHKHAEQDINQPSHKELYLYKPEL